MIHKVINLAAAIVAIYLSCAQIALADAMRCSTEQKACIAECTKSPNRAAAPACVTNCRARNSMCMQTGCWDNGRFKYCGLARQ